MPMRMTGSPSKAARSTTVVALLAILLPWGTAAAQALDQQLGSATCLALAGACGAVQDPAALWHNPAQLVSSPTFFTLSLDLLNREQTVHRLGSIVNQQPPEVRDLAGYQITPAVSVALPLWGHRLWGALGYHSGLQLDSLYPDQDSAENRESPARYRGTQLQLHQYIFSAGLAFQLKKFSVGAALELSHVTFRHQQSGWAGVAEDLDLLEDPDLDLVTHIEGQNTLAVGGRFGAWWAPRPWLSVNVSFTLPLRIALEGETAIQTGAQPPYGYTAITAIDGKAHIDLKLPLRLQGGLALGPPRIKFFLEGAYAAWSIADGLAATSEGAALLLEQATAPQEVSFPAIPLSLALRDQFSVHAGLALQPWSDFLTLRLGYAYYHGATRPEAPSSTLIDLSRHSLGLGLFAQKQGLRLGLAFAKSFQASLETPGDQALIFNPLDAQITAPVGEGQYRSSSVQVLMEVGYGW